MNKKVLIACPGERRTKLQSACLYDKGMLNAFVTGISPFGWVYKIKLMLNNVDYNKDNVRAIKLIDCSIPELIYRISTRVKILRPFESYLHRLRNYIFGRSVINYFKKNQYDITVLHVYSSNTGETALFIKEIKKIKPEVKVILEHACAPIEFEESQFDDELREFDFISNKKANQRWYLEGPAKQELQYADLHIVGSDFVSDILIKYGVNKENIFKLRKPLKEGLVNYDQSHDFRLDCPIRILIIGKVSVLKGAIRLIETAKILGSKYEFRFAGEFILDQEIKKFRVNELPSNCKFLGNLNKKSLSLEIGKCMFGIHASLTEDDPYSVIEFLEFGVPVIVGNAAKERIIDGVNGYFLSSITAEILANNIKLRKEQLLKIRMDSIGRSLNLKSNYNYCDSYINLINRLI